MTEGIRKIDGENKKIPPQIFTCPSKFVSEKLIVHMKEQQ